MLTFVKFATLVFGQSYHCPKRPWRVEEKHHFSLYRFYKSSQQYLCWILDRKLAANITVSTLSWLCLSPGKIEILLQDILIILFVDEILIYGVKIKEIPIVHSMIQENCYHNSSYCKKILEIRKHQWPFQNRPSIHVCFVILNYVIHFEKNDAGWLVASGTKYIWIQRNHFRRDCSVITKTNRIKKSFLSISNFAKNVTCLFKRENFYRMLLDSLFHTALCYLKPRTVTTKRSVHVKNFGPV